MPVLFEILTSYCIFCKILSLLNFFHNFTFGDSIVVIVIFKENRLVNFVDKNLTKSTLDVPFDLKVT